MPVVTPNAVNPRAVLFGLPLKTKATFFRQVASMVDAGLPVGRAVSTASTAGLTKLGREMALQIDGGSSLSETMARYPYHFDRFEIALVKAGESAGQLDHQLKELADQAEENWKMVQAITSKLIYPALVVHAGILLPPLFLLVQKGVQAYLTTVLSLLVPLYTVALVTAFLYRFFRLHGGPRRFLDHFMSAIPILGTPFRLGAKIRFLAAMANLTQAGFLPNRSVEIAAQSCGNYWLSDRVLQSWEKLGRQTKVSEVLQASGAFAPVELGLVLSGEEAGSMEDAYARAAANLKPEYQAQVHRLATVLPVLLLLVVGTFIGFVAVRSMLDLMAPLQNL